MSYLTEFQEKLKENDYPGFLKIWEEYCFLDNVNYEELRNILLLTKTSELA